MNNKTSITYLLLIIAPFVFGCRGPVNGENKANPLAGNVATGQKYSIDTKASVVTWTGGMLVGTNSHTGNVYISNGDLIVDNGQLVGGSAVVDMNTIEERNHGGDNDLVKHLKNADFFDVEKFPTAVIAITGTETTNGGAKKVTGNLTIKGITHPVTFPASMEEKDGVFKMNGRLVIDRTQWGVLYKSGKFYDLLADQTMSDYIEFNISVTATK